MFNLNKYYGLFFCALMVACGEDSSFSSPEEPISSSVEIFQENGSSNSLESSSSLVVSISSTSEESSSSLVVSTSSTSEESSSSLVVSTSSTSEESSSSLVVSTSSTSEESSSSLVVSTSSTSEESSSSQIPEVMSVYDSIAHTLTDLRDGHVYKTVIIGEQVWIAENMNYKYKAGSESFCYNNSEKYCSLYGRLYTSDSKNVICPEKWHLPDSTEWEILFKFTGNQTSVLKADSGWIPWGKENTNGTNDFGFSVYPAGYQTILDGYTGLGSDAHFWVRKGDWIPYIPDVNRTPLNFVLSHDYKAIPIRCIKDSE